MVTLFFFYIVSALSPIGGFQFCSQLSPAPPLRISKKRIFKDGGYIRRTVYMKWRRKEVTRLGRFGWLLQGYPPLPE